MLISILYVLLFLSLQMTSMTSFRRSKKTSYSPYGPKMCKELCDGFKDSFTFLKTHLVCYHTSSDTFIHMTNLSSEVFFTCFKKDINTTKIDLKYSNGRKICVLNDKGSARRFTHLNTNATAARKPETVQGNFTNELHQSCRDGKLCKIMEILSLGQSNINCRDRTGMTPVMTAVNYGQIEVFDFLVSRGCDLTAVNGKNNTVLHLACSLGNIDMVRTLFDSGRCKMEAIGLHGLTPLIYGVIYGHLPVYKFLERRGVNIRARGDTGLNVLHFASAKGHVDIVQYLFKTGVAERECRTIKGETPVLLAVSSGQVNMFELLVSLGCDPKAVNNKGCNILHLACLGGHTDMVKHILSKHVTNIDSKTYQGITPVMYTVLQCRIDLTKILAEARCNMKLLDKNGYSILHLACLRGRTKLVKYILSLQIFDINSRSHAGLTPVMIAAMQGKLEVLDLLQRNKCNMEIVDSRGNNLLHVACKRGYLEMVKYLSQLGLRWNNKNRNNRTPLEEAMMAGNSKICEFLTGKD